jgi:hypothetical protein
MVQEELLWFRMKYAGFGSAAAPGGQAIIKICTHARPRGSQMK